MAKKSSKSGSGKTNNKNSHWLIRILIVLIVGAALGVSMLFETQINAALGLTKITESDYSGDVNSGIVQTSTVGDLNVHFLDVGQGDACIIEFPDNKKMLIDAGKNGNGNTIISYINDNIKDADGNTITEFDYAMLTHTDEDHCGSMDEVLNVFPAKVFYRPNVLSSYNNYTDPGKDDLYGNYVSKSTAAYKKALEAAYANPDVEVVVNKWDMAAITPDGLTEGDAGYYSLEFYGPISDNYKDWNNYSPVMILSYGDERIALSGDCEKKGESEFVEKANSGDGKYARFTDTFFVSAIKLGHHGSRTSSSEEYLNIMTTSASVENTIVIISCGFDNEYGHPHSEVLERLSSMGFKDENIMRTDENGTIVLSVRDEGGVKQMYCGANAVVKTQETSVDWRYIAISVFAVVLLVVLVLPLFDSAKKEARSVAKKTTKKRK